MIIILWLLIGCKNNRAEEFVYLRKATIDSNHFAVSIYSKTKSDSIVLYTDTLVGEFQAGEEFKTKWFNDSVECIVPVYIPENTFRTHTNLKVVLKHK